MNEFEKYEKLSIHMERMAKTGSTGSPKQWQEFTSELNQSIIKNHGDIGVVSESIVLKKCNKYLGQCLCPPWGDKKKSCEYYR